VAAPDVAGDHLCRYQTLASRLAGQAGIIAARAAPALTASTDATTRRLAACRRRWARARSMFPARVLVQLKASRTRSPRERIPSFW
jgi:hypothetical protein